jgi:uridine kinase
MYSYEKGTPLFKIAADVQKNYAAPIVLAFMNERLLELHHTIKKDATIEFITLASPIGMQAYWRTAILMMLKAFYAVVSQSAVDSMEIQFSLGDALFIRAKGDFQIDEELLLAVKEKMLEYANKKYPIKKISVHTPEAIELFKNHKMSAKARLFRYRRTGRVNLYSLGHFDDYFYGEMLTNASLVKVFDLVPYKHGFLLHLPSAAHYDSLSDLDLAHKEKLFNTLNETIDWTTTMHVRNAGDLNDMIAKQKSNELVLIQEALQEHKIAMIARQIVESPNKKLVMIAGPSSSGKTTFSHRLSTQLSALGKRPHPIAVDNYFVEREKSPRNPDGSYNFEILECLDIELLNSDLRRLLAGERVSLPTYNFQKGKREYHGNYLQLGKDDLLVIEGIHALNDALTYSLDKEQKFKIYISALSSLNIDEHNYIPSTDERLIRRIVRDHQFRGVSAAETIRMWPSVRKGEEENIFPFQEDADVMFNSSSIYELAVLKPYAESLLFAIEPGAKEAYEARRLLKFLDYFLCIDSAIIPQNSLIREFIGGSSFQV